MNKKIIVFSQSSFGHWTLWPHHILEYISVVLCYLVLIIYKEHTNPLSTFSMPICLSHIPIVYRCYWSIVTDENFLFPSAGPMFFLSCFSFVVGIAMLYYYRGESYRMMEKCADLFVLEHLKLLWKHPIFLRIF